jgi:AraC family transcriptional regulator of adaptative response / DNA-3-methyladenine glycosylase II
LAQFFAARAIPGVEVVDRGLYRRSIEIDGAVGTIEVAAASPSKLDVRVAVEGDRSLAALEARLRRWFDLDADVGAIGRHLAEDPLLAPLVASRRGLRVPGAWDPLELAIRAIVGQQISVSGARTIAGRLVARCGDRLPAPADDIIVALFPRPSQLAAADLGAIGMPGARVRAIQGFAAAVAAEPGLLRKTDDLDQDVARLRALPGVGEWTAQYIALRGLKHQDAFPASDLGILRALAGPDGRRPTPGEALSRAERWRPYRAYAAQHLWSAAT